MKYLTVMTQDKETASHFCDCKFSSLQPLDTNAVAQNPIAQRQSQFGFTLMELMITVSILAIVASIAMPSFTRHIAQKKSQQGAMDIIAIFKEARSNAALINQPMTLTISNNNRLYEIKQGTTTKTSYTLSNELTVNSNVGGDLIISPSGAIQGATAYYFRICANAGNGYSTWINSRGIMKQRAGPVVLNDDTGSVLSQTC